jgi:GAF domain
MRWLVEVTSLGRTEKDSLYVDAETWQKALQVARTLRGETDPMSGFSIELLDEGCRAVDPATRISYEVRRAAEDARPGPPRPSTAPPRPAAAETPAPPSAHPSVPPPAVQSVVQPAPPQPAVQSAPPQPAVQPAPPQPAAHQPFVQPAAAPATTQSSAVSESPPRLRSQFPPRPQISATATMMLGNPPAANAGVAVESARPGPDSKAPRPEGDRRSVPLSAPRADSTALPSQIVFKREQDATEALPLTYREYVYVVPPGSTEMAAATLVQAQLELVRASLDRMAAGKLVNLAVFDVAFQGKPPVPPLATLTWKDWRGVALVTFPRQPGRSPVTIPTGLPVTPTVTAPAHPVAPALTPAPAPAAPSPVSQPAPAFAPMGPGNPFAPIFTPAPTNIFAPTPNIFAPAPAPTPNIFAPTPAPAFAPTPAQANIFAPTPAPANVFAPTPPPAEVFAPTPAPALAPTPAPAFAPQPFAPVPQPFVPASPFAETPAPPYGRPILSPVAPPVQPVGRIHGEDLIADLFESMHDLHFARDTVDGGDFCLSLAMTKLPSLAGIVQLYDIDRREFVVTNTRGEGTDKLLLRRFPESDGLLAAAMRKRRAVVFADAIQSEATTNERYVSIGGARSLIVAPVMLSGRFLGAIELLNPIDGEPFTESDGNAVTYIAEQFAEFVAARGIVTDPERISARPHQ